LIDINALRIPLTVDYRSWHFKNKDTLKELEARQKQQTKAV
jgi:hypothetical protein